MTPDLMLLRVAVQLDVWADESISGGWSTHQVTPMRNLAAQIRRTVGKAESDINRASLLSTLRDAIAEAKAAKRETKRYSSEWHRRDAEVEALEEMRDYIKKGRA